MQHSGTSFRSHAARLNFLALDRSDLQFATKGVCSGMSNPTALGEQCLKRVVRYLVGAPRLVWFFSGAGEEMPRFIDVHVDSDWAGKLADRRSTSGGVITVDGGCLKTWSRTQKTRALSSGEAEYYSLVGGAAEGLGLQAVAMDLGWQMEVRLHSDAKAARGMAARRGLGKTRHVEVKYLWLQQAVRHKRVSIVKVAGTYNPSNHLTKPLSKKVMQEEILRIGGSIIDRSGGREEAEVRAGGRFREEEDPGEEWEFAELVEALGISFEEREFR